MEASELDYANIHEIIGPYVAKGRSESASFLNWFLEHIYRMEEIAADDAICDSSNDKGIDGLIVDNSNTEILLFQAKLRQKPGATLGDTDLKQFYGSVDQFSTRERIEHLLGTEAINPELRRLIENNKLPELIEGGYIVRGVFVSNQEKDQNAIDYLAGNPALILYDREKIVSEYIDVAAGEGVDHTFQFSVDESSLMEFSAGNLARMYMFPARGSELVQLQGISDGSLFERNVRLALGNTNVNRDIAKSFADSKEHIKFPLYHNGITMLCDEVSRTNGTLSVKKYVVVNGAQSLTIAYRLRDKITSDLRLVLKVIELSGNEQLASQITTNSNNQNPTKARDLRSNHQLQIRLQQEFEDLDFRGYWYSVKRGEEEKGERVVNNEEAGRLLLAFDLLEPWSCHQTYRVMDEFYGRIFGRKEVNAKRIIMADYLMRLVEDHRGLIELKPFGQYKLTMFFLLYVISRILRDDDVGIRIVGAQESLFFDEGEELDRFLGIISGILHTLIIDLNYEAEELGEDFDYKSFLKSPERVKSLAGELLSSYKKDVARKKVSSFAEQWVHGG